MVTTGATSKVNQPFTAFNAGEIGDEVQGRITIDNYQATASLLENWLPTSEGPLVVSPGFEFFSELPYGSLRRFVYALDQKYLMHFADEELRVIQDGGVLFRPDVDSTVTNGNFASATGWTDISTGGGVASITGGNLVLSSNGTATAGRRQQVSTSSPNVLHALRIVVDRGPVSFRCGSTAGSHDYISATTLNKGVHSLAFTPTGSSFWIEFTSTAIRQIIVDSCTIEDEGDLVLPTPWDIDFVDSGLMRFRQTNDVLYVASGYTAKRRIERRSANSWSIAYSDERNGPFELPNTDPAITIFPSVQTGNGTLTASKALFTAGHVGALFSISQSGQSVSASITGENQFTSSIRVTGVGADRAFTWSVAGSFTGTVRLQRSIADENNFVDFDSTTAATSQTENDELANQIVYYRLGAKAGEWGTYDEEEISSDGSIIGRTPTSNTLNEVFDGITNAANSTIAGWSSSTSAWAGRSLSGGRRITRAVVHGANNAGFVNSTNPSVTLQLWAKSGAAPSSETDGTMIGTLTFTDTVNESGGRTITSTNTVTAYDHVWVRIVVAASASLYFGEIRLFGFSTVLNPGGTVDVTMGYSGGATTGICRITGYNSETSVSMEVLSPFASTSSSDDWQEGSWSDERGHPAALDIFDGRLWQGELDRMWGSQSDLYENQEGGSDAADALAFPVGATNIRAIIGLARLIVLTESSEHVVRSSAFDEPITPTNLTRREMTSYGSGPMEPVKVDDRGLFLDRSSIHLMELKYDFDIQDYVGSPLTRLHRDIGRPGLRQVAVTRRPETRIFAVRDDGQLLTKLYSPGENVFGWSRIADRGRFISVEVLPGAAGTGEDEVWALIERRVENQRRYYLEKLGPLYFESASDASAVDSFVREDQEAVPMIEFVGSVQLARGAGLTSAADGKAGTAAFYVSLSGGDGVEQTVYASDGGRLTIKRTSSNFWQITGRNAAGTIILQITSSVESKVETGLHHVSAAWDLATGFAALYIDNEDVLDAGSVLTNDTIDYTRSDHYVGGDAGSAFLNGELGAFYLNTVAAVDISDDMTRFKIVSAANVPVWLGSDGSFPSGSQPAVWLRDPAINANVNRGAGGNFTASGSLWDGELEPYFAAQSTVFGGFDHLVGETITVWADGEDLGQFVVDGDGEVDIGMQVSKRVGGLGYDCLYRSSHLAFAAQLGTPLGQQAQIEHLTLLINRSARQLYYGHDFDVMDDLSGYNLATSVEINGLETGTSEMLAVPGFASRDPRLCLKASSPYPVSVQAYVLGHKLIERI